VRPSTPTATILQKALRVQQQARLERQDRQQANHNPNLSYTHTHILTHTSEAIDTYGYRPLHRMSSNNLAIGAAALLKAGADPKTLSGTDDEGGGRGGGGETPMAVARSAGAWDVMQLLLPYYTSSS